MHTILAFITSLRVGSVVHFEGPMGVGKSTMLNETNGALQKAGINACVVEEPTMEWIDLFHQHSYHSVQRIILVNMLTNIIKYQNENCSFILMDRSPWSVCNIFMPLVTPIPKESIKMCNYTTPGKIIHITAPVDDVIQRVYTRNRTGEHAIPKEYIQQQANLFKKLSASLMYENKNPL